MPHDSLLLDDTEWDILGDDWWHTPLSTCTLSWTHPEKLSRPSSRSSAVAPSRPVLPCHDILLRPLGPRLGWDVCCSDCQEVRDRLCRCDASRQGGSGGDVELNDKLVGIQAALESLVQFERSVAITAEDDMPDLATLARRVSSLQCGVPPEPLARKQWEEQAEALLGGILVHLDPDVFRAAVSGPSIDIPSILDLDLDFKPPPRKKRHSVQEVIDLTDSEQSVESEPPPMTPKQTRSYASAVSDQPDGKLPKLHIPRIPSSPSSLSLSPPTSDELQSESFQPRSSSLPPSLDLRKDEQGFFVSVTEPADESALMPQFLVDPYARSRKPHSRTREIIDRLRCGRPKTAPIPDDVLVEEDEKLASPTRPSRADVALSVKRLFQRGSDGWIRMTADEGDLKDTSRHTSDPFYNHAEDSDTEDTSFLGSALKPAPPTKKRGIPAKQKQHNRRSSANEGGWIESTASVAAAAQRRHRATLSVQQQKSSPYAPASVGIFTFPPPPTVANPPPNAYPPAVYGAPGYPMPAYPQTSQGYMPMPFAVAVHGHGGAAAYPAYPMAAYPYMTVYGAPSARPIYPAGTITGASGIRHANW